MAFFYARRVVGLLFFLGFLSFSEIGLAQKAPVYIMRTYYDYRKQLLHEEYQFVRTANKLSVKNGFYKEYDENGVIKARAFYRNDELNGTVTTYENWGNGPQPLEIDNYKDGKHHGYSTLWWFDEDGKRLLEREGSYFNGKYDGRWVAYEHNGSKLVEHWKRGVRHGETIQYGTAGQIVREGYYDNGEPFSGTLEERFENGTISSSIAYENCFREGPTQTWYPTGKLKTLVQYRKGEQDGPTLHYLENGNLNEATKAVLTQIEAEKKAEQLDSIRQLQEAALANQQKVLKRHRQDSIQQMEQTKKKADQIAFEMNQQASSLVSDAITQQMFMCNEAAVGYRARLPRQLYIALYDKLLADYRNTPAIDTVARLVKAQRLKKLLELAKKVEDGHQVALQKALRKENDLEKVLALTGL